MYTIAEFVASRDNAIISYWENKELDTLTKHIEKYNANIYNRFIKANQIVKLMTVCHLTLGITSPEVAKYHVQAQELLELLRLSEGENNLS